MHTDPEPDLTANEPKDDDLTPSEPDDDAWDAFMPDDEPDERLPEPGDFWIETDRLPGGSFVA